MLKRYQRKNPQGERRDAFGVGKEFKFVVGIE